VKRVRAHIAKERKIEEGIYQEIKNDTEIGVECQQQNYSY